MALGCCAQAAKQGIAEMKDKLKILGNELEILQSEVVEKDRLLSKTKTQHQVGCCCCCSIPAKVTLVQTVDLQAMGYHPL